MKTSDLEDIGHYWTTNGSVMSDGRPRSLAMRFAYLLKAISTDTHRKLLGFNPKQTYYLRRKHMSVPAYMVDFITSGSLTRARELLKDDAWRKKMIGKDEHQYDKVETLELVLKALDASVVVSSHSSIGV